jgi:hypothetical protein
MLSHHNGTTGSERKFDLYSEAQDRQFAAERQDELKERMLPMNRSPEMTAAQQRAAELRTRLAQLEAWQRHVADWSSAWRNNPLDIPGVTAGLDAAMKAINSEQVKTYKEQMSVGVEINNLQESL